MSKNELLMKAIEGRLAEIEGYQINIDNYELAIPLAEADPELVDFAVQLRSLLSSEKLEQKKAKIILKVLQMQVGG